MMKTRTSLLGILAVVAVLFMPARGAAQDHLIVPGALHFGEVEVGDPATLEVTITSVDPLSTLTIYSIQMTDDGGGVFEIATIVPYPIPSELEEGESVGVYVVFSPSDVGSFTGSLLIRSNDHDDPEVYVTLSGEGVPAVTELMDELLEFFEAGDLEGHGPGNSAGGRLGAFGNMLLEAYDLIAAGDVEGACGQLEQAYRRTDGATPPPDFVGGDDAETLAEMILEVMEELGCP